MCGICEQQYTEEVIEIKDAAQRLLDVMANFNKKPLNSEQQDVVKICTFVLEL